MKRAKLSSHSDKKQTLVDAALLQVKKYNELIDSIAASLPNRRNYQEADDFNADRAVVMLRLDVIKAMRDETIEDIRNF